MSCEPGRTKAYHSDLRWRMVYQRKVLDISTKKISENLCVDPSTVQRIVNLFDTSGSVEKKIHISNAVRKISRADQLHILELVIEKPSIYLHELKLELQARGTHVDESTICRFLHQSRFSRKKMRMIAIQQSEELRSRYVAEVSLYDPDMLVFLDETGSDRNTAMRKFGYSLRGLRCCCTKLLARGKRVSAIAALSSVGILDVQFLKGSVNGEIYADFIELSVLPHLLPFDGVNPNSIVVMDNASIHYNERVRRLISSVGALLVFLPPYSPDLNPIEESFSAVKSFLRANEELASSSKDIEDILLRGFASITSEDCYGWYSHSGYYN